ncbi:Apoptosis inhibitor 5 [Hypsizygus marmoreus]|uniref:Apoptosis inhibitor 5 n=1 Tax=Hypsizygus marmoreus TaxID=39966 RepID=A0A369J400_HYPMA|nr:Apoptosis inhibitor 5 [Hypsizygus marmoreus]
MEQERELRDAIRRAKGNPDKTGAFRRDTLKRLIELTHSSNPSLRILVAQNIRFFFNDFPELEEQAINAVYDLCEDQSANVRIEGYNAVTQVSNADIKWVKRNTDVLVQLLQSHEPDEVIVVKKALTEHLDMDPKVTLGVLCDQIAPPEEPMDEEDQAIRSRLRHLVLSFLTGEAKRAIVERHALPGTAAEEVLISSLLSAIPKLGISDIEIIVKDLLLPLNSYKPHSTTGHLLLQSLLDKIASCLRTGLRSGDVTSLHSALLLLDLAAFVVVEKQAAPPIQLLRFYCNSLSSKITLQKFSKEDQPSMICNFAEALVATSKDVQPKDDGTPLDVLNKQIVDACPLLLESLTLPSTLSARSISACAALLRACIRRKEQGHWTPPHNLISALNTLQEKVTGEQSKEVYNLIRSLVPTPRTSITSQGRKSTDQGVHDKSHAQAQQTSNGRPSSLPERPSASNPPPRRMHIPRPQVQHQAMAEPFSRNPVSRSAAAKHPLAPETSIRPPKRQKGSINEDTEPGPSLLSRLGSSLSSTPTHRATLPPRTSNYTQQFQAPDSPLPPKGEYTIKGAAKMDARTPRVSAPGRSVQPPHPSLLDRLGGGSSRMDDDRSSGGWTKRSRGRS